MSPARSCALRPRCCIARLGAYADNFTPTPFSAMIVAREFYHESLSADRLAAIDGFAVFHYDGFLAETPRPRSIADLEVSAGDFAQFESFFAGPVAAAVGRAFDADFIGSGAVDRADFSRFSLSYTGHRCARPVPAACQR